MSSSPTEVYKPREVVDRGIWNFGVIQFKVYDLLADGKIITDEIVETAKSFLRNEVVRDADEMGDNNGLGFVIIHPGDLGVTIAAQWWAQGSVLCQRIFRRQHDDVEPLDTINRPAVACVWELEIIASEQLIWRQTMMKAEPNDAEYLKMRAT